MSKILIVDDDPGTRFVCRLILERQGYEVVEAGHGEVALHLTRPNPLPRVILTDLMMPIMGGLELIGRLRAEPRTAAIPIVVMTSNPEAAQSLLNSGLVDAIVGKPFSASGLADHIRAIAKDVLSDPLEGPA